MKPNTVWVWQNKVFAKEIMRDGLESLKMAYNKIIPAYKSDLVEDVNPFMEEARNISDENFLYKIIEGSEEVEKTSNIENMEFKLNRELDEEIRCFNNLFSDDNN